MFVGLSASAVCGLRSAGLAVVRGGSRCAAVCGGLAVCLRAPLLFAAGKGGQDSAGLGLADSLIGFAPRITHTAVSPSHRCI